MTKKTLALSLPRESSFGARRAALALLLILMSGPSLFAQTPTVTLKEVPPEVLIGETFTFQVHFSNAGPVGYGPFIDLLLDSGGTDNNTGSPSGPCDGITFVKAQVIQVNGGPLPVSDSKISPAGWNPSSCGASPGAGPIDHPFLPNSVLAPGSATGTPVILQLSELGAQLVTLKLPFGSFTASQPPVVVEVEVQVHSFADLDKPLKIRARGGFQYGGDALNNPATDLPRLTRNQNSGTWEMAQTIPTLFKISKKYLGKEDETATGPNFKHEYEITVDIAAGQSINALTVKDFLPNNMQYQGMVTATVSFCPSSGNPLLLIQKPSTTAAQNPPLNKLEVRVCNAIVGTNAPNDVVVEFEFFIPDKDADGQDILQTCGSSVTSINDIRASGKWTPLDPRDQGVVALLGPNQAPLIPDPLSPVSPQLVTSDLTTEDHILQDKCLAIQKSVTVLSGSGGPVPQPGDLLRYQLDFQVSDYKTIAAIRAEDILSDGQKLVSLPKALAPKLQIGDQVAAYSLILFASTTLQETPGPVLSCAGVTGGTKLEFDVSAALAAEAASGSNDPRHLAGILTGGLAAGSSLAAPAQGQIVYFVTVQQVFDHQQFPPGSEDRKFVDKHDPLNNCVAIHGDVYKNAKPLGNLPSSTVGTASDDSLTQLSVVADPLEKSVFAVRRVGLDVCNGWTSSCQSAPEVLPGDRVTFRVEYKIPSGNAEDLKITDWLPLPVFSLAPPLNLPLCPPSPFLPSSGICRRVLGLPPGERDTLPPPMPSSNTADNSFSLLYDPVIDISPATAHLLFTSVVTNEPFADGLLFTNEVQECEDSTFDVTICQVAVSQVRVRQPELSVTKGVVATDNANSDLEPVPAGTWDPPGSVSCPRFNGTVASGDDIDINLQQADAGDQVTFAIAIENTGGAPAYNIQLNDILPLDCFKTDFEFCVSDGAGTPIDFTTTSVAGGKAIQIDPAFALPSDPPSSPGENVIVITFDATLKDDIQAGCCTNKAELTSYSSRPVSGGLTQLPGKLTKQPQPQPRPQGRRAIPLPAPQPGPQAGKPIQLPAPVPPPDFVKAGFGGPFTDDAHVCMGPRPFAKCIQATSEPHTAGGTALAEAAIGEIVRFRLVTTIPEGITAGFVVSDLLPAGLTDVGNASFTFVADKTVTDTAGNPFPTTNDVGLAECSGDVPPSPPGQGALSFPIDIKNDDNIISTDPNPLEYLVIEFNAIVDNALGNQDGTVLPNKFQVRYQDKGGNTVSADSGTVNVHVVEPQLTLSKTASPALVEPGDVVGYTITIANNGSTDAFDIEFKDSLPTNLSLSGTPSVSGSGVGCSTSVVGVSCAGLPAGGIIQIEYRAKLSDTATCPLTLTNQAQVTWTSLPGLGTSSNPTGGQAGPAGTAGGERDGVTPPPGLNDYSVGDQVTVQVECPRCDLALEKTADHNPATPGVTWEIKVTNVGNGDCQIDSTQVTDQLPSDFTPIGPLQHGSGWDCTMASSLVTCQNTNASIAPGGPYTVFSIEGIIPGATPVQNCATASSAGDSNTTNDTDCVTVGGQCDLRIEKRRINADMFEIWVFEEGNAPCPPPTSVSDNVSADFKVLFVDPNAADGWTCSGTQGLSCSNPSTIPAGYSGMVVQVIGAFQGQTSVQNCAQLKNSLDSNSANDKHCIFIP